MQQRTRVHMVVPTDVALTYEPKLKVHFHDQEAQHCFYAFTEGLPAPAHLWQELPEQIQWILPSKFMILISVLDNYLVCHQGPDDFTTSWHVCRGSQGDWRSSQLCLETSLIFMSPLQFLIYSLRVFTDSTHTETLSIEEIPIAKVLRKVHTIYSSLECQNRLWRDSPCVLEVLP